MPSPPNNFTRMVRLLFGIGYLALVSLGLSEIFRYPFAWVFLGVVVGALSLSALALTWATLWARRRDSRLGQFGIASLFFLTVFVAVFFAAVRWITDRIATDAPRGVGGDTLFGSVAITCLMVTLFAIPLMIGVIEALLWTGVWVIRRPWMQRWLAVRRRNED